jgi:hypothetical protein
MFGGCDGSLSVSFLKGNDKAVVAAAADQVFMPPSSCHVILYVRVHTKLTNESYSEYVQYVLYVLYDCIQ